MSIRKALAAAACTMMVTCAQAGALAAETPERFSLNTGGRPVTVQAAEAACGSALTRGGSAAEGLAGTGDISADGRTLILTGDLNMDGTVTIADLVLAAKGMHEGSISQIAAEAADVNANGQIDVGDLAAIARMVSSPAQPPLAELPPFPLDYFRSQVSAMIAEMNACRATKGLPPLQERADMDAFCQVRAEEQLQDSEWGLSHARPDGSGFWEGASFPPSREILHHCWADPESGQYMDAAYWSVQAWIQSPSHEAIMANPTAKYAGGGIAYGKGPDGSWWWKSCIQIGHEQD